jgi:hypothetical protein
VLHFASIPLIFGIFDGGRSAVHGILLVPSGGVLSGAKSIFLKFQKKNNNNNKKETKQLFFSLLRLSLVSVGWMERLDMLQK